MVGRDAHSLPLHGTRIRGSSGSVLMESVLALPILIILILAIAQFSLIWYAKIMTQYAAYNAARAALVYHPGDYRISDEKKRVTDKFMVHSGPCWEAACRTLAWVSSSPEWQSENGGSKLGVPGWYELIPNSSHIEQQVRIVQKESIEMTNAPVMRVTVEFDYPLHVPVVGHMLAYLDNVEKDFPSKYEAWGWSPNATGEAKLRGLRHKTMNVDYITLRATAILPKLWRSSHFARDPKRRNQSYTAVDELDRAVLYESPSGVAGVTQ